MSNEEKIKKKIMEGKIITSKKGFRNKFKYYVLGYLLKTVE